jgi:predicted negative regulator of RcsB-dependent stress response
MIPGFMSSEKPQPEEPKRAQRQSDIYDLLAWVEANKMKVLAGAVVLTLIGFAIATMRYMREQKELRASSELLALRPTLIPNTNVPPVEASALAKLAQEFSGTAAAERARLLAASTLFTDGKYAEAEAAFKAFQNDFPNSDWRPTAAYGIATAQEAQNKPEAVSAYQSVAATYAKSAVADDAKLALARIHEQKNEPAEALRIYNELLTPRAGAQPGEAPNRTASERKEALLRAHPDLNVITNAAPVTTSAPETLPTPGAPNDTLQIPAANSATNPPAK